MRKQVFPAHLVDKLYKSLYLELSITSLSSFYTRSGRAVVCGEVLGSVLNATSNKSSATILAYWPERHGTLASERLHVGCVQYYCLHSVKVSINQSSHETMVAYVSWKENHSHSNFFSDFVYNSGLHISQLLLLAL